MTFNAPFSRVFRPPFGPGLEAGGEWWLTGGIPSANCIAAYQPKGAASYAASLVNLANPGTYDAYEGVAPDWDAINGWKGDGTKYLKTGVIPTSLNWSYFLRFSSNNYNYMMGASSGSTQSTYMLGSALQLQYGNGKNGYTPMSPPSNGVLAIARLNVYFNGVAINSIASGGSVTTKEIYILALNFGDSPFGNGTLNIQAFAIYNIDASSYQSDLYSAMAAL